MLLAKLFKSSSEATLPHILNLRHRYFWDGGIHCSTLDLDREGTIQDYFPSRK